MSESLADQLQRLCCAETEGKFFDLVTDSIDEILAALRAKDMRPPAQPVGLSQAMLDEIAEISRLVHDERVSAVAIGMRIRNVWPSLEAAPPAPAGEPDGWQWRHREAHANAPWSKWANIVGPIEDFRQLWKGNMCGDPTKSAVEVRPLYATPPQAQADVRPSTLPGMIAAIYGELDRDDCAWIDSEWARMRGYVLPKDGTSTLQRSGQRPAPKWRHLKRGSIVTEVARGFAQVAVHPIEEMTAVVIYKHDADGRYWVRNAVEFDDGRFEPIESSPQSPGGGATEREKKLLLEKVQDARDLHDYCVRTERAEDALRGAGWTYIEGAQEWKPPLGPSASPLLDQIDNLRQQITDLQHVVCDTNSKYHLASAQVERQQAALTWIETQDRFWTAYPNDNEVLDISITGNKLIRGVYGHRAKSALSSRGQS